jgi:hypothetical protein
MMFECFSHIRCECSEICTEEVAQTLNGKVCVGPKYQFQGLMHQWWLHSTGLSNILPFKPTGILEFGTTMCIVTHAVNEISQ